jgi:hypothetical protein
MKLTTTTQLTVDGVRQGSRDVALELLDSRTGSKGLTIQVDRPAGRSQSGASEPEEMI